MTLCPAASLPFRQSLPRSAPTLPELTYPQLGPCVDGSGLSHDRCRPGRGTTSSCSSSSLFCPSCSSCFSSPRVSPHFPSPQVNDLLTRGQRIIDGAGWRLRCDDGIH